MKWLLNKRFIVLDAMFMLCIICLRLTLSNSITADTKNSNNPSHFQEISTGNFVPSSQAENGSIVICTNTSVSNTKNNHSFGTRILMYGTFLSAKFSAYQFLASNAANWQKPPNIIFPFHSFW